MLRNYFLTLARQLWRNRLYTGLNIFGLSICICVAWIVFRMVDYEYSFDKKIPGAENIYQVVSKRKIAGDAGDNGFAGISKPVLNALKNQVTGAELVVPMFYKYQHQATVQGLKQPVSYADKDIQLVSTSPDYFRLLHYQWLAGNPATALDAPDKVVLTDTRARAYFPSLKPQDVIGRTITYDDTVLRRVSAVVAQLNYPNSFSADNNEFTGVYKDDLADDFWGGMSSNDLIYITPVKGASVAGIMKQLNAINFEHNKEDFQKYKYESWYDVLPLSQKHFEPQYQAQTRTADKKVLAGLMIIGAFLLLIACINYINLSTAQLPQRAKEIGIRKTLGSSSRALIQRFIGETFITTSIAALLSFLFTSVAVKVFADFLPEGLFNYMNYESMMVFMLALIIVVSLLSGLYPAWLSSRVNTVNVLKGVTEKVVGRNRFSLRKGLIVFQFLIAQVFIIGSIIIGQQLRYALHKDLGFDKNRIITVDVPYYVWQNPQYKDRQFVLKNELKSSAVIEGVSLGNRPMSNTMMSNILSYYKDTAEIQQQVNMKFGDADYLKLYGFHLLAGRNYMAADTMHEIVINEKAVKAYGFKSPQDAIGKVLTRTGEKSYTYPIVGVIADFHQFGVRSEIEPALIASNKNQNFTINIKLPADASKWKRAIQTTEQAWKKLYTGIPFKYTFYDDGIKKMYDTEEKMQKLVGAATAIAIVISCLGLFGLATLTAFKRTKEVGIRKVLGASVAGIVRLLSTEFLSLVIVSAIIATPIAWWLMHKWLQDFAYRVTIQWWMFVVAAIAACIIALLTVSYQAVKAAMANPVKSLRTE
ncbi:ABC transporter permease [Parafilimonas sp.]|uniref:ABC transporter permease n=1 Tax=Parafilimonas sp. TaxID=1969739 RepID=UPI0039E691B9